MIKDGYGAVFVKIFDAEDREITPPKVTHFRYIHSEKADDGSTIVIESMDTNLSDNPALQEDCKIKLLWGYIGGKISGKRSVYIIDTNASYDESGVRLELKCSDRLSYLKQTSSDDIQSGDPDELAKKLGEANGLEVFIDGVHIPGNSTETPAIQQLDGTFSSATESTAVNFQGKFIPQANMSDFKVLRDSLDRKPGGPWVLEGRDDNLSIKKRDFNQVPYRAYTYKGEPAYLLKFQPETKNKSHRANTTNINASGWNPETKSFIMGDIGQVHDKDVSLGEYIDESNRIPNSEDPVEDPESPEVEDVNNSEAEDSLPTSGDAQVNDLSSEGKTSNGDKWIRYKINNSAPSIKESDGTYSFARESTSVIVSRTSLLKPDLNGRLHTVGSDDESITAEAINKRKESELSKNNATGTILGDPELESGKIITILNVSKKHSGNYYLTQTEHVIEMGSGYVVNFTAVKQGYNIPGPTKVNIKKFKKPLNDTIGIEPVLDGVGLSNRDISIDHVPDETKIVFK